MQKKLTVFEAACIVAGNGIGGGVMAVPYLASKAGIWPLLLTAAISFAAALILHLMLLEASLKSPGMQILSILDKFLFKGRKSYVYLFFALITLSTVSNLAAYLSGGAAVMEGWGINMWVSAGIFYALCAAVVLFGIKSMGIGEKGAVIGMMGITAYIAVVSFSGSAAPAAVMVNSKAWLALYGMLMFCLGSYFAIPQVVVGLAGEGRPAARAVVMGLLLNVAVTVVIALSVLKVSGLVTKVAIVGWSDVIGGASGVLGSAFVWLALATSFWSISYALKDIIMEQFGIKKHMIAWLLATAPAVFLLTAGTGFIELLKLAGGATALVLMFTLIPAFVNSRKQPGSWSIGAMGGSIVLVLIVIAYAVMALGSLIPVE